MRSAVGLTTYPGAATHAAFVHPLGIGGVMSATTKRSHVLSPNTGLRPVRVGRWDAVPADR